MNTNFILLVVEILLVAFHYSLFNLLHYLDADKSDNERMNLMISKLDSVFVNLMQVIAYVWVFVFMVSLVLPFYFLNWYMALLVLIYSAAVFIKQAIDESDWFFLKWSLH